MRDSHRTSDSQNTRQPGLRAYCRALCRRTNRPFRPWSRLPAALPQRSQVRFDIHGEARQLAQSQWVARLVLRWDGWMPVGDPASPMQSIQGQQQPVRPCTLSSCGGSQRAGVHVSPALPCVTCFRHRLAAPQCPRGRVLRLYSRTLNANRKARRRIGGSAGEVDHSEPSSSGLAVSAAAVSATAWDTADVLHHPTIHAFRSCRRAGVRIAV